MEEMNNSLKQLFGKFADDSTTVMSPANFNEFVTGCQLLDAVFSPKQADEVFVDASNKETLDFTNFRNAVAAVARHKYVTIPKLLEHVVTETSKSEFYGAGQTPGLVAWRIENKIPVPVPSDALHKLYTGDSYIFLKTIHGSSGTAWNIHFWLGKESSVDEIGIAAYKTVELDESLGGGPVQYREVQDNESELFLQLFEETIEYLQGGVDSGFKTVVRGVHRTRLLRLKGAKSVRVTEVKCVSGSLNTGDAFLLDLHPSLFVFYGADCSRAEKLKAQEVARGIKDGERGGKAALVFVDEDPHCAEFWEALGGEVTVTDPGEDDAAADARVAQATKLLRVSDSGGELTVTEAKAVLRAELDTEDVFLLDADDEVFVWVGKACSPAERKEGVPRAQAYLAQAGKPAHTRVTRLVEGMESNCAAFRSHFTDWESEERKRAPPPKPADFSAPRSVGVAKAPVQEDVDVAALASGAAHGAAGEAEAMVDGGGGALQIWRIEQLERVEWPERLHGQFYAGDSFLVLYTYTRAGSSLEEYIIYFWQGVDSSQDEKAASALQAKQLDDEMGDRPVQCRVVQGKEPEHFRQLFAGRMVVHSGGCASGFKNRKDEDSYDTDGVSLFHVKVLAGFQ